MGFISYEALSILFALTTVISGVAVLMYRSELKFYKRMHAAAREYREYMTAADEARGDLYASVIQAQRELIDAQRNEIAAQADLIGTLQRLDSINDHLSVTFTAPEAVKPRPGDWDSPAWMPNLRGAGY